MLIVIDGVTSERNSYLLHKKTYKFSSTLIIDIKLSIIYSFTHTYSQIRECISNNCFIYTMVENKSADTLTTHKG